MRQKDSQKRKLYDAENEVFMYDNKFLTDQEIIDFVAYVRKDDWVRKHMPEIYILNSTFYVEISKDKRRTRAKGSSRGIILIDQRWARRKSIILHELAHVVNWRRYYDQDGHGRKYAKIYLELIRRFQPEYAHELRKSFAKHKVKYRAQRVDKGIPRKVSQSFIEGRMKFQNKELVNEQQSS